MFDARLILAGQQPDIAGSARSFADMFRAREEVNTHRARLADMMREQQERQTLANIYRQHVTNQEGLPTALLGAGFGKEAFAAQDQTAQMGAQRAALAKTAADWQRDQEKRIGDAFYGVKDGDQEGWALAREAIPEQFRHLVPETYDPGAHQRLRNLGVPAETRARLEATSAEAEARRKFETEQKDLDRRNRTKNAGIVAGNKQIQADEDAATGLRKEINANKQIAKYRNAEAELTSLRELAKDSSGANDMAIVFAFMKAMDPESVVREAEYAAAAATGTPDERMRGLVSKYWTGGPLSAGQRQAFIRAAEAAQSGHKIAYGKASGVYRKVAKRKGFDLGELGLEDEEPSGGLTPDEAKELEQLERELGGKR